jgi:hypothetical protein
LYVSRTSSQHHAYDRATFHIRINKTVRLNKQRHAELLRSRIEELNLRLAILNSERGRFEKLLDGVRE